MTKKIFNLLALIVLVISLSTTTYAQNASPSVSGVSQPVDEVSDLKFPIGDLGNCSDYKTCLTFCEDPVNNATCVDFAKKKGFYKDDPVTAPTDEFLQKAKDILGCDSVDSCMNYCSDTANFDKCNEFAKSQNIPGAGYVEDPTKAEIIEAAKTDLGCDSAQGCLQVCGQTTNASKCDGFADKEGLLGGEVPVGPGGCNTDGTCSNYCSDPANFEQCAKDQGNFTGPGGCNSPETCRNYCEENPNSCRSYAPGSNGVYVPASCPANQDFGPGGVCTAADKLQESGQCAQGGKFWNGSSCQDNAPPGINPTAGGAYFQPRPEMGNCSTPGSCYDFCKENPGKCASFDANASRPKDGYIPALYYTPGTEVKFEAKADMGGCDSPGKCYDFCKENPGKCGGFDSKAPRPVDTYMPGTYYTPSSDHTYFTPPATGFYVTPIYFTPPAGSNYTTPSYYTPGMYSTPNYYTPFAGSNYSTPTYYTPGSYYATPSGQYPTPSYSTPTYYTPPILASYNTPTYYTPATYTSPSYYSPSFGSGYTSPSYNTPPAYTTPQYYTPYTGGSYSTPTYYTPPAGSNYTTPNYSSPSYYYPTPTGGYTTPSYQTPPAGSTYTSPTYYTPGGAYYTPSTSGSYSSPSYYYPTPGSAYTTPGTYPSPAQYTSPSNSWYTSPNAYVSPSQPNYFSPPSYVTPAPVGYETPPGYNTPSTYSTPAYGTPESSYNSPSYGSPAEYPTPPGATQGASTERSLLERFLDFLQGK